MFVRGYRFLSFAKNMGNYINKNISKNLSGKYSQKFLDHAKQLAKGALKTPWKKWFKKQQQQLVIWFVTRLPIKLQKPQKIHHRLEAVESETDNTGFDKEILKEKHISPEKDRKLLKT